MPACKACRQWFAKTRDDMVLCSKCEMALGRLAGYAEVVVHGTWEGTADGYADGELVYDMWNCSNCGWDVDGADEKPDFQYCPKCGAKMDLIYKGDNDSADQC